MRWRFSRSTERLHGADVEGGGVRAQTGVGAKAALRPQPDPDLAETTTLLTNSRAGEDKATECNNTMTRLLRLADVGPGRRASHKQGTRRVAPADSAVLDGAALFVPSFLRGAKSLKCNSIY